MVIYLAKSHRIVTIDGREKCPASCTTQQFIDPKTGKPYPFTPDLVTSGVSVGVPGTPATWQQALDRWGTLSLGKALFYRQLEAGMQAAYDDATRTMACNMMDTSALEGVQAFIDKRPPRW